MVHFVYDTLCVCPLPNPNPLYEVVLGHKNLSTVNTISHDFVIIL